MTFAGCESDDAAGATDALIRPDLAGDSIRTDPGDPAQDLLPDTNGLDEGAPDDAGTDPGTEDPDTQAPDTTTEDPGPGEDVPMDAVEDTSFPTDTGNGDWPPSEPWWGQKKCLLPACDTAAEIAVDLSGKWTRKLTAISHDCNKTVESIRSEIKPGNVTTEKDQIFTTEGNCTYDEPGGVVTGKIQGDTMINCILQPPSMGVTAMPTGWLTFDGDKGFGKSSVHLYDIPMLQPSNCVVQYDVEYTRQ
jgi:hypothetical protein